MRRGFDALINAPVYEYAARVYDLSRRCAAHRHQLRICSVAKRDPHEFWDRFSVVMRALRAEAAKAYGALEVGSAQAKILRHIGKNSRISQADLARATDTAPTLTGRALETLIERGWIR